MPPLDRAVALTEVHDAAVPVGQHLHLHVPRIVQVALDEHGVVREVGLALAPGGVVAAAQLGLVGRDLDALATAAGRSLDRDRVADRGGDLDRLVGGFHRPVRPRDHRHTGRLHQRTGADLGSHRLDGVGRRPDEHQLGGRTGTGEGGVLGQEAEPGVYRLGARPLGRADQRLRQQVALRGRAFADQVRLVGVVHERRIAIGLRVDRHRADAHLAQGAEDADGDLAAVCDQHLLEHQPSSPDPSSSSQPAGCGGRGSAERSSAISIARRSCAVGSGVISRRRSLTAGCCRACAPAPMRASCGWPRAP